MFIILYMYLHVLRNSGNIYHGTALTCRFTVTNTTVKFKLLIPGPKLTRLSYYCTIYTCLLVISDWSLPFRYHHFNHLSFLKEWLRRGQCRLKGFFLITRYASRSPLSKLVVQYTYIYQIQYMYIHIGI